MKIQICFHWVEVHTFVNDQICLCSKSFFNLLDLCIQGAADKLPFKDLCLKSSGKNCN